jgi:hypothetical protein
MINAVKGLLEVRKNTSHKLLIFRACKISLRSLNVAFPVEELLLNPNCSLDNIALFIICFGSIIYIIFFKKFKKSR